MNYVPQSAAQGFFPNIPDATGQVFAYRFGADGRLVTEDAEAAWTWRSYLANDIRARMTIEKDAELPGSVREALLAPGHASYLGLDEGWMHGDLPDLRHDYSMEGRGLCHFRFALDEKTLIGGCKQPLRSIDHVRHLVEKGTRRFRSPSDVVEAIVSHSLDGLHAELVKVGQELDAIEERIVGDHWHGERQTLKDTRRNLVLIHREMVSFASLFRHLEHQHHPDLPTQLHEMAERLSNRTVTLNHDGEQLQAQARLLQDELMAKLSAQSNQLLYFLSLMTAVLLPMSIISGLMGMNVGGIPFSQSPGGFWTVSLFAVAMAGLVLWVLRRMGRSGL
jgi:zinc transporter